MLLFLIVSRWDAAQSRARELLKDPKRLERRRQEMVLWWSSHKAKVSQDVARYVYGPAYKAPKKLSAADDADTLTFEDNASER